MCRKAQGGFVCGGIATRAVSPVSKLVNPQHMQPVHPKGHGPMKTRRDKIRREDKMRDII
jgi:hypothetical protein